MRKGAHFFKQQSGLGRLHCRQKGKAKKPRYGETAKHAVEGSVLRPMGNVQNGGCWLNIKTP